MPGPLGPPEAATESRVGTAGAVTGRPVPKGFALSARQLIMATGLAVLLAAAAPHAANRQCADEVSSPPVAEQRARYRENVSDI